MTECFVGLGSNLNNPLYQVQQAIKELSQLPACKLLCSSSLYRSKPLAGMEQPDYINAVAKLNTDLSAEQLLEQLFLIEDSHGRQRKQRWGSRSLDLDLLLYGKQHFDTPALQVPHPEIIHRCFVLLPLLELGCREVAGIGSIEHFYEACEKELVKVTDSTGEVIKG